MDAFKDYMDKVKAETELKEKTKAFINSAMRCENAKEKIHKKEKSPMKKLFVAAASVAACALLTAGGYAYYNTPVNYVSVDINPSIELGINRFGTVVTSESYNEDGELILKEAKLTRMALKEAIDLLIREAAEQGYIAEDGSSVIAVTSESDDDETAAELEEASEEAVNVSLSVKNLNAIVYADCSSLELRTEAKELGISPGKYKLVAALQAIDPEINIDDYKDAKITDIIVDVNLQMGNASDDAQNEETDKNDKAFENALDKIAKAAEKVEKARGNVGKNTDEGEDLDAGEQEQEQNNNQGSGGDEREQNMNQNSDSTGQEQEQSKNKGSEISEQNKNKSKAVEPSPTGTAEATEAPEESVVSEAPENRKSQDSFPPAAGQNDKTPDKNRGKPAATSGNNNSSSAANDKGKTAGR